MAEFAVRHMTVAEFLHWEDGTDTRYELVDGLVVAMAPPRPPHGALIARLVSAINTALEDRPECIPVVEAGIIPPNRSDSFYVADIGVSCDPPDDAQYLHNPFLIVEILSPSTAAFDRNAKISAYQLIPSVQEILLLDSRRVFAEVFRRDGDGWISELAQGPAATLTLRSVPLSMPIATLYRGLRLSDQVAE